MASLPAPTSAQFCTELLEASRPRTRARSPTSPRRRRHAAVPTGGQGLKLITRAATRRALLDAAAALLDAGGPEAVTLREVGARAGASRGAPYRHFADKESLLTVVATESWDRIADALEATRPAQLRPRDRLRHALITLIEVGRTQPHLYQMMFSTPTGDPEAAVRAASRAQDEFLAIVADVVEPDVVRRTGALLLAAAHGIAGLELSGHLLADKWDVTAEDLVDMLVTTAATDRATKALSRPGQPSLDNPSR